MTSNRKRVIIAVVAAGGLTLAGCVYYKHWYTPIRAVRPILVALESATSEGIDTGTMLTRGLVWKVDAKGRRGMERDPNRIQITGRGADEVKRALLRAMERGKEAESLNQLFGCVMQAREEGNIVFHGEKDWAIIAAAAERFNAEIVKERLHSVHHYFVTQDTNGIPVLDFGINRN